MKENTEISKKMMVAIIYFSIGILFCLYDVIFGSDSEIDHWLVNIILWPIGMFPVLGKIIGGILTLIILSAFILAG